MPALRHRAAHFALRKLGMFNRSYRERIAGRVFTIPIINGRKTYASEEWMAEVIRILFSLKEGAFVDVGVNLGQTLLKVAAVDPSRPYVGFEPNPACVDYVWKLISSNQLPYKIVPAGIANKTSLLNLEMFRDEDTDPSASTVPSFRQNVRHQRPVVVVNPADLGDGLIPDEVAVVKIDVEGGELWVIEALLPILRSRPFFTVEILPASSAERRARQDEIQKLFRDASYDTFRIRRGQADHLTGFEPVDEIGVQTDLAMCDYVFAPREHSKALSTKGRQ